MKIKNPRRILCARQTIFTHFSRRQRRLSTLFRAPHISTSSMDSLNETALVFHSPLIHLQAPRRRHVPKLENTDQIYKSTSASGSMKPQTSKLGKPTKTQPRSGRRAGRMDHVASTAASKSQVAGEEVTIIRASGTDDEGCG